MTDLAARAAALQEWAYPLLFAQRMRLTLTQPQDPWAARPPTSAGAPAGRLGHQRALADPSLAVGVAPNVDTLYSLAWIDLAAGEHELVLPEPGDRYFSLQVACADTASPVVVSRRTHPRRLPKVRLGRGPRAVSMDDGTVQVATPERWAMVVGRAGVDPLDPADIAAAHALQDGLSLARVAPDGEPSAERPRAVDRALAGLRREDEILDPGAFAMSLLGLLEDLGPGQVPAATAGLIDRALLTALATGSAPVASTRAFGEGLREGYEAVRRRVQDLGRCVNGWSVNDCGPEFGDDLLLRAAVAHAQIFVNPVAEASYPVCEADAEGRALDGRTGPYRITFAPGRLPPAAAFWSLTMYHAEGLLVSNPLRRYAVGDRTPGLARDADGGLSIDLSTEEPAAGTGNWLPAPAGPFRLMMRLYWPQDAGAWEPPPVVGVAR